MIFAKSTISFWLISLAVCTVTFAVAVFFKGGWRAFRAAPRRFMGTGLTIYGIGVNLMYLYHYHLFTLTLPFVYAMNEHNIAHNYHMDSWFYLLVIGFSLVTGWMLSQRAELDNLEYIQKE